VTRSGSAATTDAGGRLGAPLQIRATTGKPKAYRPDLVPIPSMLRPHCKAEDRLMQWKPAFRMRPVDAYGNAIPQIEEDLARAPFVLLSSLEMSTRRTYGSGLLIYTVFADARGLDDRQRFPPSQSILVAFVAAITGSYLGDTISKYLSGLRFWHNLHTVPWLGDDRVLSKLVAGANKLAPHLKRMQRSPVKEEELEDLAGGFDHHNPLDVACHAVMCISFYSMARLGELTVPNEGSFDASPEAFTTAADVVHKISRDGHPVWQRHVVILPELTARA
jgi:hypothetical protein